jgi:hypothetical protein
MAFESIAEYIDKIEELLSNLFNLMNRMFCLHILMNRMFDLPNLPK